MIKTLRALSFFCFLILSVCPSYAQIENVPPVRHVLGAAGGTVNMPGIGSVDFTVGEVVVSSASFTPSSDFPGFEWLTQGFQQPDESGLFVKDSAVTSECIGANNGVVYLKARGNTGAVEYSFNYNAYGTENTFKNLPPGIYPYSVKDEKFEISGTVTVEENQVDCKDLLLFYSGITPNGDGINDFWVIDSITNFNSNIVTLFNRWGNKVWSAKDYDNVTVVWAGTNQRGEPLPDATYFYIVEVGEKIYKGWVELTH